MELIIKRTILKTMTTINPVVKVKIKSLNSKPLINKASIDNRLIVKRIKDINKAK